jgi:hypothetical protein
VIETRSGMAIVSRTAQSISSSRLSCGGSRYHEYVSTRSRVPPHADRVVVLSAVLHARDPRVRVGSLTHSSFDSRLPVR